METKNNGNNSNSSTQQYNFIQVVLRILEVFLLKGYQTVKCSDLLNGHKFMEEIENALMRYIRGRNSSDESDESIVGYIFQLYIPMVVIAFNYSFKDPYLYKDSEEEVSSLRGAFLSEAYPIFTKLLEYVVGDATPETADLKVIRERLTSLLFRRLTTFGYFNVVKSELTDYPCNMTPGEKHLRDIEDQFKETYGRNGSDQELADFAGCRVSTIRRNRDLRNSKMVVSLDIAVGDGMNRETTLGECIECEYKGFLPDTVLDDMLSVSIDEDMKDNLSLREYKRMRTRIDNDDLPEMEIAKRELGADADKKKLSACQRSINRDLAKSKVKLSIVMHQYKDDVL